MEFSFKQPNRKYEAVIILHPDMSESEQKSFFKKNAETIKKFSGSVNHLDTWGKRRLGNPIQKLKVGTYFHTTFEADSQCVEELERTMKINDKVLRFLHSRLDDRVSLPKFVENFKDVLTETKRREQEREAKFQKKRARK